MHTLYDIETQIPASVHITTASVHDSKAMPEIPYEPGAHYVFDRSYNDYGNLYKIDLIGGFFIVRAKTNVRFKPRTWKRRLKSGVKSDAIGSFTVYKSSRDYPEELRKIVYADPNDGRTYIFLTNNLDALAELICELYRNRWSVEALLQMDQTTSQNQEVLGYIRKRRANPNLLRHNYLLPCGDSTTRYAA